MADAADQGAGGTTTTGPASGVARPPHEARRGPGGWKAARRARHAVQVAALALFVYLLFAGLQSRDAVPLTDVFFRFDPLAAFGTMLSAREWMPRLAPAVVTVVAALVLGRVWCGWICPLGTILEWSRFKTARRLGPRVPPRLRSVKYVLLGVIVVMAAFGSLTLMVLDPISLLTRTATTSIVPAFAYAADSVLVTLVGWGLGGATSWVESTFRGNVLPFVQPHFAQGIALFLLFLAVVLLNVIADRFWCRYLCPLGALLGLLAKVQVLRPLVGDGCTDCGACVRSCRLDAIEPADRRGPAPTTGFPGAPADGPALTRPAVVTSECTMCLDCFVACPEREAMSLGISLRPAPWEEYDPGRRALLTAAAGGVGAVALLGTGVWRTTSSALLIRPPGAQDERAFLSRCLRCSECMKVCPTSGLQPALLEAGLEGLWTPVLASRLGYCDYSCTACGNVCPSGAIPRLPLEAKRKQVLGVAVIDRDRCLPWAQDTPCIVCQEMCPVAPKAVLLDERRVATQPDGRQDYVQRPRVLADRCIGCGICEYKCPVQGTAAIVVEAVNPAFAQGGTLGRRATARRAAPERRRPRPRYTPVMAPTLDEIIADLRVSATFARLDDDQLRSLAQIARPVELPAESTLFLQGDHARALFLLSKGRVKVFKLLRDGRTATVRHVSAGQTFAEAALFHDEYPASTETMTECKLYRFETDDVLALLAAQPQFAVNMIASMAYLLGLLNRRVEELLLPVPARLARYLLALADEQLDLPRETVAAGAGHTGPGGRRPALQPDHPRVVKLPTSKRELAARLGTVPETLSRTFDRLKRAEVIRMSGDHELIEILSFDKLHRLAQD